MRDILDIKPGNPPRPKKKSEKKPVQDGQLPKELANLLGERVPPVALQSADHYKKRFTVTRNAQAWRWQAFENQSREDGLRLKHWVKQLSQSATPAPTIIQRSEESKNSQDVYHFAKYNYKPAIPTYTDAEYEQHLQSKEWTKEETDYLFNLVRDFDLRWILIEDRYDYLPSAPTTDINLQAALVVPTNLRSMEDLKARYYEVAAKTILLYHPQAQMTEAEFEIHEGMTKFDPERERRRKEIARSLLLRSPEEIKEEEILLAELRRIVANEERFLEERQELYNRLDHPIAQAGTAMYETASGLQSLVQSLYYSDKNKKRRSLAAGETSSPAQNTSTPTTARDSRRDVTTSSAAGKKKGSLVHNTRVLTLEEEKRFGVSTHDRLNSGVSFRSSRVDKLVLAKSQIQSAKLQDAIRELNIPLRPRMPTIAVCAEYEKLIIIIHNLLDARKVSERINNEIRIAKVQKGIDQDENNEGDNAAASREEEDDEEDDDDDAEGEADGTHIEENIDGENANSDDEKDHEDESKLEPDEDNDEDNEAENSDDDDDQPAKASIESDNEDADRPLMPGDVEDEDDNAESVASPESPPADEEEEEEEEEHDEQEQEQEEDEAEAEVAADEDEDEQPSSSRASLARSIKSTRSGRSAGMGIMTKHKRSASAMSVSESEKSTGTRTSKRARK